MDFDDEGMADLTMYQEGYEWTEERYLRLRFKALRHIASHAYFNDAYAYLIRTRPDEIENSKQVYNENQEQWLSRTARIRELQTYAEAVLEEQACAPRRGYYMPPPGDVLIPPSRPMMASEMGPPMEGAKPPTMVLMEPWRKSHRMSGGGSSKASSLSPNKEVQKEDRDAAIEAVRKITKASRGTLKQGGGPVNRSMNITGTPRYDWDDWYDGIQGLATQLRNRVSDPPTPQRCPSPKQSEVGVQSSPARGNLTSPRTGV